MKTLTLHRDRLAALDVLDDKQVSDLFRAIKAYVSGDDTEPFLDDVAVRAVFVTIRADIISDEEHRKEVSERRRESGRKGGMATAAKQKPKPKAKSKKKPTPDGEISFPPPPKPDKRKTTDDGFVPPTLKEVEAVFRQSAAELPEWQDEAKIFYYHYDGLGWRNTHGVRVRNWDSFANKWIFDKIQKNKKNGTRENNSPGGGYYHTGDEGRDQRAADYAARIARLTGEDDARASAIRDP